MSDFTRFVTNKLSGEWSASNVSGVLTDVIIEVRPLPAWPVHAPAHTVDPGGCHSHRRSIRRPGAARSPRRAAPAAARACSTWWRGRSGRAWTRSCAPACCWRRCSCASATWPSCSPRWPSWRPPAPPTSAPPPACLLVAPATCWLSPCRPPACLPACPPTAWPCPTAWCAVHSPRSAVPQGRVGARDGSVGGRL